MDDKLLCKLIDKAETNDFYRSLCKQYHNKGSLSPKQMFYVYKLEREENKPETVEPENSPYKGKTIKLSRFIIGKIKESGVKEVFVVNEIIKVHKESYRAILVDIKPIRSYTGICTKCGRTLTDEVSKSIKFGPVCAQSLGLPKTSKINAENTNKFLEKYFISKEIVKSIWIPKRGLTILE